MTENPTPPAPEPGGPPPPSERRLLRSRSDRVLSGVCGGVARYFGIDAVIVRIAAIGLTLFGGAGLLLYIAAWLLVPEEDPAHPGVAPDAPTRNRWLVILGVVALVAALGPILFIPAVVVGGIVVPLAILVLLGLGVAWLVTGNQPGRDARSITKATLIGLGVLVLMCVLAVGAFWGAAAGGEGVIAGLVIAAGAAVVAAAFVKPARWLILPALALAIPAGFVAAADISLDGGLGDKTYRPGTVAEIRDTYEIGAGDLTIDLRGVDLPAGDSRLNVDVGMGHAQVIVDPDVCVATTAEVGMGAIAVFGNENGGVDVDLDDVRTPRAGAPRVLLDADVGLGFVEVRHDEAGNHDRRVGPGRRWSGESFDDDPVGNAGCVADEA